MIHIENERFIGRTNFHSGLLNSMVALSIKDIEGVARLCKDSYKLRRLFSKELRQGIRIFVGPDGVVVDACIWIEYGYAVADVCYRVQESVINTVQAMIEDRVTSVNLKIVGVSNEQKTVA